MKIVRLLFIALYCLISACASKVNPTGGAKDVNPPVLKEAVPANYSTNFNADQIILRFDEYIQLSDVQNKLIVSPVIEPRPVITVYKKDVRIELPDSLPANKTFTFNFGTSITDVHEGNVFPDYQYVFSTGNVLDSLAVSGKVLNAATHERLKNISVMLYRYSDTLKVDSILNKYRPDYYIRTADDGSFNIRNIAAGKYYIYGLDDKNSDFLLGNLEEEGVGFQNDLLEVPVKDSITLFISNSLPSEPSLKRFTRLDRVRAIFTFTKPVENLELKELKSGSDWRGKTEYTLHQDSLFVYLPDTLTDSLQIILNDGKLIKDTVEILMGKVKSAREIYYAPLRFTVFKSPSVDGIESLFKLSATRPFTIKDLNRSELFEDSSLVNDFTLRTDSLISSQLNINYNWKESKTYKIRFLPGFATDDYGFTNDTLTYAFSIPSQESVGGLTVNLVGEPAPSKFYLLELLTEKYEVVRSHKIEGRKNYIFSFVPPGIYRLRITEDRNQNGKWDPGTLSKGILPENIFLYPATIQLRANWDLETELPLP